MKNKREHYYVICVYVVAICIFLFDDKNRVAFASSFGVYFIFVLEWDTDCLWVCVCVLMFFSNSRPTMMMMMLLTMASGCCCVVVIDDGGNVCAVLDKEETVDVWCRFTMMMTMMTEFASPVCWGHVHLIFGPVGFILKKTREDDTFFEVCFGLDLYNIFFNK